MAKYEKTVDLFVRDFSRTLFPLNTNKILVQSVPDRISDFIYKQIAIDPKKSHFLPQTRAYASKSEHHLRRTFKLDPVAEFFIYDLVYKNRQSFVKDISETRRNYGYGFKGSNFISPTSSYMAFKADIQSALKKYKYIVRFDIATYFNSIYHHDLVNWFDGVACREDDATLFDTFLKQINVGRSVDCLPHGIMPAKIIGNGFLNFVEKSKTLRCEMLLRFMDDFYIFSNNKDTLVADFFKIQKMLGEKALSINSAKTSFESSSHINIEGKVDEIKLRLLKKRKEFILASGWEEDEMPDDADLDGQNKNLDSEEVEYLFDLLKSPDLEESDAELILALMREHSEDLLDYMAIFLDRFPGLVKNIFYFSEHVDDVEALSGLIKRFLKKSRHVTEFQLFWLAKLAEERLADTQDYGDILIALYDHDNSSAVSKAKVLEIPEKKYGMDDLREANLKDGSSDWLAWASAVGTLAEKKKNRNHLLNYFSNGSHMNKLISGCVTNI